MMGVCLGKVGEGDGVAGSTLGRLALLGAGRLAVTGGAVDCSIPQAAGDDWLVGDLVALDAGYVLLLVAHLAEGVVHDLPGSVGAVTDWELAPGLGEGHHLGEGLVVDDLEAAHVGVHDAVGQ